MAPPPTQSIAHPSPLSDAHDPSFEGFKRRLERIASVVGSQNALAKKAAVPQSTIRKYFIRGDAPRSAIIALAAAANVRPEWLLTGSGAMAVQSENASDQKPPLTRDDIAFLPLYGARRGSVPSGTTLGDYATLVDYLPYKRSWLKRHVPTDADRLALLYVPGDAMEPLLRDGDTVFVDLSENQITEGIFAVVLADQLTIKRLQPAHTTLRIVSESKSYDSVEVVLREAGDRLKVIGRVFSNIQHIF